MSHEIPVYQAERDAGLTHAIRSNASVAYLVPLEALEAGDAVADSIHARGQPRRADAAAIGNVPDSHDDDELFYMKDVLVTSCWNINDDVFERLELWAARHTSRDKPLNFNHNQADIIGHIVASQPVDEAMVPLADDLVADDVPSTYHIVNGSVIYRLIGDKDRREFIEQTIAEIKAGKWFVSMEALFRGFDYAVKDPDGVQHVVARNEQTAWLTKYLRAYPPQKDARLVDPQYGSGTYVDRASGGRYAIGRLMRHITFCGKGLVEKPGNSQSIIFKSEASFMPTHESAVYVIASSEARETLSAEPIVMSETNAEVSTLQARLAELVRANETLNTEVSGLKSKDTQIKLTQLEADLTAKASENTTLTAQLAALTTSVASLTVRAETAETARDTAQASLALLEADKVQATRKSLLLAKLAPEAVAAQLLVSFKDLSAEAFASTVEILAPTWAAPVVPAVSKPVVDATTALERAIPEKDVALAAATTTASDEKARVSTLISEFLTQNVLRTAAKADARGQAQS